MGEDTVDGVELGAVADVDVAGECVGGETLGWHSLRINHAFDVAVKAAQVKQIR